MWFFAAVFIWMAMYFITLRLTTGSFTQSDGWELATSHGFFLIGLAFIARIFARYAMPAREKTIFWVAMIAALGITIYGLAIRISAVGQAFAQANASIIQISAVLTALVLVPALILFFGRSIKSDDEIVATRSFLIGTGLALLLWHGISLVLIPLYGPMPWLVGEALNVLAFSVLLTGILYQAPKIDEKFLS